MSFKIITKNLLSSKIYFLTNRLCLTSFDFLCCLTFTKRGDSLFRSASLKASLRKKSNC